MDGNGVSRQEMKPMPAPPSKLCLLVFAVQGAEDTHGAIDGCPMTNDGDVPQPQSAWRFGCRFCQLGILSEEDVRESHDFEKRARGKMEFPQKSSGKIVWCEHSRPQLLREALTTHTRQD